MEKIYRILLGIFLVCLIPILLVLSYWSCRYSYYGTVDYSIRNLLIKDSTWKHFVIFLLTSDLVYEGDKWLNAQNQKNRKKSASIHCWQPVLLRFCWEVSTFSTIPIIR